MHRQLVTRTEYLAELNRRLRQHPAYAAGMQFVPHGGPDPETANGFNWVPEDGGAMPPMPFAEVAAEVHSLYRVLDL
ncbi:MAG TPA: hypothetical protein VI032_15450 [Burkholderiaceae bacterium]